MREILFHIAARHVGQKCDTDAPLPLDDPEFSGPWRCSGLATWIVLRACGAVIGATRLPSGMYWPSTELWIAWGLENNAIIEVRSALSTSGAFLLRYPRRRDTDGRILGHLAISGGDSTTIEALNEEAGVRHLNAAHQRTWDLALMPPEPL
jgi:N-acetylmuramoyl-L-alanine amidase